MCTVKDNAYLGTVNLNENAYKCGRHNELKF